MARYVLTFSGTSVGLIVRGKKSHAHEPGLMEQHADCILSDGSPIGFFGEGWGGASSGDSSGRGGSSGSSGEKSGAFGMGLDGAVYDMAEFKAKRAPYVDKTIARTHSMVSAVLVVPVSATEATAFDAYWKKLDAAPDTFYILGGNCSTRASRGFSATGILGGGIPGLDTPDNLWRQLCREKAGKVTGCYGYVGFTPAATGYTVEVDEP